MEIQTKVYDNAVPQFMIEQIEDAIAGEYMDWYYNDSTSEKKDGVFDTPQLTHEMFLEGEVLSDLLNVVAPIVMLSGLPVGEIYRIKANMLFNFGCKDGHNPYHKDANEDYYSLLYYVNDSDGDTVIKTKDGFDKIRVTPKRGRFVVFESSLEHHSTPPSDGRRMVVNFIIRKFPKINTDIEDVKENIKK